ncbi:MAG TPA: PaaI family thioesterase [Caulobacteraceae bacterium]|nr:PaaI family thioesterase [Caulobacteraceae bacterium]
MNATERFAERQKGYLPDRLGLEINLDDPAVVRGRFAVAKHHVAPNGYLHAASVVALVDTACGYGCMENLPEGGVGFTTIELKANFLGTATDGRPASSTAAARRRSGTPRPRTPKPVRRSRSSAARRWSSTRGGLERRRAQTFMSSRAFCVLAAAFSAAMEARTPLRPLIRLTAALAAFSPPWRVNALAKSALAPSKL